MSRPPTHLLFIVSTGRRDPAGIKRVYDLLPLFHAAGYRTRVISYRWEWLWQLRAAADRGSHATRRVLWWLNALRLTPALLALRTRHLQAALRRAVRWADVVIINQTSLDEAWRTILAGGAPVVYDLDDAVWEPDPNGFSAMLALSTAVAAGNAHNREHVQRVTPGKPAAIIPTGVRLDSYLAGRAAPPEAPPFVVGWVGSPASMRYLEMLKRPLEALAREREVVFRVVGAGAAAVPEFAGVRLEVERAIPYDPVDFVPGFHVGVMPLFDTPVERGKCGAKALEYMAAGVPVVCSPVGVNTTIVSHGVAGFLAASDEEWLAAFRQLAASAELRREMGAAGRERVRREFSSEVVVRRWHDWLTTEPALQVRT